MSLLLIYLLLVSYFASSFKGPQIFVDCFADIIDYVGKAINEKSILPQHQIFTLPLT